MGCDWRRLLELRLISFCGAPGRQFLANVFLLFRREYLEDLTGLQTLKTLDHGLFLVRI